MKAKNVTLGIKSLREGLKDFSDTFKAVQQGEQVKAQPEGIYFTDFGAFRKVMTPQRYAILKLIREQHPDSISCLAAISGRNIKNVSDDVKALINLGLVETLQSGRNKAPHLKYEKITLELAV
jgi:predicted transcriptional regulator